MKVEELLKAGYINDETKITITCGRTKKRGNWFHDHILDLMEEDVEWFEMNFPKNDLFINVKYEEKGGADED